MLEAGAVTAYRELLLPLARVLTPNLPEAEVLLDRRINGEAALDGAARELAEMFGTAVFLKGGHLEGAECVDVLVDAGELKRFTARRIAVAGSHGTGCTLSAAVAALMAQGQPLSRAAEAAKTYLGKALRESYEFQSSGGNVVHALNQGTTFKKNGA